MPEVLAAAIRISKSILCRDNIVTEKYVEGIEIYFYTNSYVIMNGLRV